MSENILMMKSALELFSDNLFLFLSGETKNVRSLLIKKHRENLQTHGDFSFPNSVKSWHGFAISNHISQKNDLPLLEVIGKELKDIIEESKTWNLQVVKAKEEKCRVYLFLERPPSIRVGLSEALYNNIVIAQKMKANSSNMVQLDKYCEDNCDLSSLRTKYICNVIKNLCAICDISISVFVTSKSTSNCEGCCRVLCGTVLNAKSSVKETATSADDFIRLRQDEMTLIAQHKYGVRVTTDSKWKEFIAHLGESAAAFELLQTKPSGPVKINFDCSSLGSSKGASFILYNCARLETLIKTYNDKVTEGTYPKLPQFDIIDFALLSQEDEWHLIFNYIMGVPSLLKNCVESKGLYSEFRPHLICSYLCSMVRVFSQYYRKVRILVEPRKHLLPVIFARVHMMKILNDTLKMLLTILNIKSVSQM